MALKQLWAMSRGPIFHQLDETIRGHVFCSFFALVLKKALEDRIVALSLACLRAIPRAPNLPQAYNDLRINLVGAARRVR
jgi:hypothetical protein